MKIQIKLFLQKAQAIKIAIFLFLICASIQTGQTQDQYLYHINGTRENYATAVATHPGEIAVTGYAVKLNNEENQTPSIPFICKKDHHGNVLWIKHYLLEGDEYPLMDLRPNNIIKTFDNGYLIGGNAYDEEADAKVMFLLKTDADGDRVWLHFYNCQSLGLEGTFYCDDIHLNHVTENLEGGYLISGYHSFEHEALTMALAIKVDHQGWHTLTTAFYQPGYEENELIKTVHLMGGDNISLIRSTQYLDGGSRRDIAILKRTDQQFNTIWDKKIWDYQNHQSFYPVDLTVGQYANIFVLGQTSENTNVLVKLSHTGNAVWGRYFAPPAAASSFFPTAITKDYAGNPYFSGMLSDTQGNHFGYVIKTNPSGTKQWAKRYGSNSPHRKLLDIEMIRIPENEFNYGDQFVAVGSENSSITPNVTDDFWVLTGSAASGETACRLESLSQDVLVGYYTSEEVELEQIDLIAITLEFEFGDEAVEYERFTCFPFAIPLAGQEVSDQVQISHTFAENDIFQAIVAPNPSTGSFTIRTNKALQTSGTLYLYNSVGHLLLKRTFDGYQDFNLENYPKGTYVLRLLHGEEIVQQQVIIQ